MGMPHKVKEVWKKKSFCDEFKGELDIIRADDLVIYLCDFNADIDKKKIRNLGRKTRFERRKISLLKDVKIRK